MLHLYVLYLCLVLHLYVLYLCIVFCLYVIDLSFQALVLRLNPLHLSQERLDRVLGSTSLTATFLRLDDPWYQLIYLFLFPFDWVDLYPVNLSSLLLLIFHFLWILHFSSWLTWNIPRCLSIPKLNAVTLRILNLFLFRSFLNDVLFLKIWFLIDSFKVLYLLLLSAYFSCQVLHTMLIDFLAGSWKNLSCKDEPMEWEFLENLWLAV